MTLVLRLIWLIGLAALIVGSLAPAQSGVMHLIDLGGINDKVEHFTAYAVLGAALELGQLFSPGRTCDWHDLLANTCGILAGLALVRILQRFTFNSAANG